MTILPLQSLERGSWTRCVIIMPTLPNHTLSDKQKPSRDRPVPGANWTGNRFLGRCRPPVEICSPGELTARGPTRPRTRFQRGSVRHLYPAVTQGTWVPLRERQRTTATVCLSIEMASGSRNGKKAKKSCNSEVVGPIVL